MGNSKSYTVLTPQTIKDLQTDLQVSYIETDMGALRLKHSKKADTTYNNLQQKYNRILKKFGKAQHLVWDLQSKLQTAENYATTVRHEREQCVAEHRWQQQQLQASLDAAVSGRHNLDAKWHKDFEHILQHHSYRVALIRQDWEWKLRSTEQACKAKIVAAETAKREFLKKVKSIDTESRRQLQEYEQRLKSYQAEVVRLRGLTELQADTIMQMTQKLANLKPDANKTVTKSIDTVLEIQLQCNQKLSDTKRQTIYRIDEKTHCEVAAMWKKRIMNFDLI